MKFFPGILKNDCLEIISSSKILFFSSFVIVFLLSATNYLLLFVRCRLQKLKMKTIKIVSKHFEWFENIHDTLNSCEHIHVRSHMITFRTKKITCTFTTTHFRSGSCVRFTVFKILSTFCILNKQNNV